MAEVTVPAASGFVRVAVGVFGVTMVVLGLWAWLAPASFADLVDFPLHVHFLHDAGVFQIGIGVGLLAALKVRDALVVVLTGFLVANTLHAINHGIDLAFGGHVGDMPALGSFSVLAAVALALRVRQLGRRAPSSSSAQPPTPTVVERARADHQEER